jgi:hypothetical protein
MKALPIITAITALTAICVFYPARQSVADPPDPFAGHDSIMTVKVEIKKPKTLTEEEFRAVRAKLDSIDLGTGGGAEHHPAKNTACGECHFKEDKIKIYHETLKISETKPAMTCGGCHSMEVSGKMPFWVKPFVSLDDPQKLPEATVLLDFAKALHADIASHMNGLPSFEETKIDIEVLGKGLYKIVAAPTPFFHARSGDFIPSHAASELPVSAFGLLETGHETKTLIEAVIEAKVLNARDMEKHIGLQDSLPTEIRPLFKDSNIELKYNPNWLPTESLDYIMTEVAAAFPNAVLKKNEAHKKEWETPATADMPKGTITAEIKTGQDSKV